jgi:hypothetical protein
MLVLIVLLAGVTVIGTVAIIGLTVMGWNLVAVLWTRWRCHGSWCHPKHAHRGHTERDRSAQQARPLWRWLLELPPLPMPRRR